MSQQPAANVLFPFPLSGEAWPAKSLSDKDLLPPGKEPQALPKIKSYCKMTAIESTSRWSVLWLGRFSAGQ